jgi:methyl-accepting chemotaxis protein
MHEINCFTSSVAALLQQQIAAMREISHDVSGAAASTKEAVGVLDRVARAVAKNCDTADTVLMAAEAVEAAAASLSDKVETFLRGVAA